MERRTTSTSRSRSTYKEGDLLFGNANGDYIRSGHWTRTVWKPTYTHTSLKAKREAVSKTARRLQAVPDQAQAS
jgi:hypothetical protein